MGGAGYNIEEAPSDHPPPPLIQLPQPFTFLPPLGKFVHPPFGKTPPLGYLVPPPFIVVPHPSHLNVKPLYVPPRRLLQGVANRTVN
jgi:hypothetical protein